jgi:DNA-binding NtrC family response regulator
MKDLVLSVGYDRSLMIARTMVLRQDGFEVKEVYSVKTAMDCLHQMEKVDFLLLCHTVPGEEQNRLIAIARHIEPLLPVLCVEPNEYATAPNGCYSVRNIAPMLLNDIRKVLQQARSRSST